VEARPLGEEGVDRDLTREGGTRFVPLLHDLRPLGGPQERKVSDRRPFGGRADPLQQGVEVGEEAPYGGGLEELGAVLGPDLESAVGGGVAAGV
jgi:hypothetical protein